MDGCKQSLEQEAAIVAADAMKLENSECQCQCQCRGNGEYVTSCSAPRGGLQLPYLNGRGGWGGNG